MTEAFYWAALGVIAAAYAVVALMVVWNVIGPRVRGWGRSRKPRENPRAPQRNHTPGDRPERPHFHPNL